MQTMTEISGPGEARRTGAISEEITRYLERVRNQLTPTEDLPGYLGGKSLQMLFVEPDVLKRERVARPDAAPRGMGGEPGPDERAAPADPRARFASEAQDIGEALYGEMSPTEAWRRIAWREAQEQMKWAVLLAPPGQGKTLLTQWMGYRLARQALAQRETPEGGLDTLPLPIWVRLNTLAQFAAQGMPLREALRHALIEIG